MATAGMQVHEWGGVFQDLISYSHLRQFRPGMRLAINTHGGHYWSTEGQLPRPSDIMSLRIDHGERTTLELSDIVLSPTRYIMSWLRQRGWHMPANRWGPSLSLQTSTQTDSLLDTDTAS